MTEKHLGEITIEKIEESNISYVINKTERACSYEFGKAGNRFKLYFETAEDLDKQIKALELMGLYVPDTPTKSEEVK